MANETDSQSVVYECVRAVRKTPEDHPNDHIDVIIGHEWGDEYRRMRFDVAENVARFRREVGPNVEGLSFDVSDEIIHLCARYIYEHMNVDDVEVYVDAPDCADGVVRSRSISDADSIQKT